MKSKINILYVTFAILAIASIMIALKTEKDREYTGVEYDSLPRFESDEAMLEAFKEVRENNNYMFEDSMMRTISTTDSVAAGAAPKAESGVDFSETNIQVAGVDEADILKTDGKYIYALTNNNLAIIRAYPEDKAEILSLIEYDDFYPQEIFIEDDKLVVFGSISYSFENIEPVERTIGMPEVYPSPRYISLMAVKLYDISDRSNPEFEKTWEFEGNYLTSRKIKTDVYFDLS